MKKKLEKRFSYLYTGEFISFVLFIVVSYPLNYLFMMRDQQLYSLYSFWLAFILLEFLLLQGTIYWYSKLKRLREEKNPITPGKVVRLLHRLKKVNVVIIIFTILAFLVDLIIWYPSLPLVGLAVALFVYIFAILEFINYFYIQLSYDNISDIKYLFKNKKLKKSCMSKDFKRV
ncbi:general stress protein [Bacillus carboniphilus]|uniref:General stress protein n=1 Tax=Bacillus carboniphilus TaxID=86663 RepID=A0ABY9JVK2_9BACI|nr:general stress protein [Bacillus carboniphilus]WLR42303.1 general stress protein [Bacillus carboniphilus]